MKAVLFHSLRRLSLLLSFIFVAASLCAAQGRPEVLKVDPPNWWAGHSINPVRLLIRGRGLEGARVEAISFTPATATGSREVGITTGLVRANERGTYLFLDVYVEPTARPGKRNIRLAQPARRDRLRLRDFSPTRTRGSLSGLYDR